MHRPSTHVRVKKQADKRTESQKAADARRRLAAWRDVDGNGAGVLGWTGQEGRTPLHVAARAELVGVVRLLMEHGADPTAEDNVSPLLQSW